MLAWGNKEEKEEEVFDEYEVISSFEGEEEDIAVVTIRQALSEGVSQYHSSVRELEQVYSSLEGDIDAKQRELQHLLLEQTEMVDATESSDAHSISLEAGEQFAEVVSSPVAGIAENELSNNYLKKLKDTQKELKDTQQEIADYRVKLREIPKVDCVFLFCAFMSI